ncbi:MAG TPA: HAD-IIIA family hydrolase [Perlabentimonas sp.]|nr:HAD-IIIA family hydrolase [Bacteroidales bacterium]MDD4673369.1 HAD-IIIA family hydrolase [Bacteroidales bacterium]MDY0349117.1 HAD-IIIA family hydrolase [Tenuifilaceae bacterium]HZJ74016.1 HAD-IIIA family hydrolase [Perlabentimonas sp.]
MKNFKERLQDVKAFAFDVDGVFTDGSVIIHSSGELLRSSNTRDGYAVKTAVESGFPVAIITGGKSDAVGTRFRGLGVTDIYLNATDKLDAIEDFRYKYGLELSEILFMGDDIPDYEVMQHVGFPTCPADAAPEIVELASYISNFGGGKGCVRDVIEQVLKLKNLWLK